MIKEIRQRSSIRDFNMELEDKYGELGPHGD
jgi:hypothetical protein